MTCCSTWSGRPISPNNVLRSVFAACDDLQMPRTTWLTFRRTYASSAHNLGMAAKVIAQLMGHAKVDTTLNVYAQVLDGSVREATDRIGGNLFTIDHTAANCERSLSRRVVLGFIEQPGMGRDFRPWLIREAA